MSAEDKRKIYRSLRSLSSNAFAEAEDRVTDLRDRHDAEADAQGTTADFAEHTQEKVTNEAFRGTKTHSSPQ